MAMIQNKWLRTLGTALVLAGPLALLSACSAETGEGTTGEELGTEASAAVFPTPPPGVTHFFDGTNDRLFIPFHPGYGLATGDFTLELSVKLMNTTARWDPLFSKSGLALNAVGDQLQLTVGGNLLTSSAIPNLRDTLYHTVAVTRVGTQFTFYFDGVAYGMATSAASAGAASGMNVGSGTRSVAVGVTIPVALTGDVRDVRLWRGARTQAELAASATGNVSGVEPGLIGFWNLFHTSGDNVADRSPVKNNAFFGTVRNADDDANPELLVPWQNRIDMRLAGDAQNAPLDQCSDILIDGTMEYFHVIDITNYHQEVKDWFCSVENFNKIRSTKVNFSLAMPSGQMPITVGAGFEGSSNETRYKAFCSDNSQTLDVATANQWVGNMASSVIVDAWLECMQITDGDNPSTISKSHTASDDGTMVILNAWWNHTSNLQQPPTITGFQVTGATCTGGFTLGAQLGVQPTSMSCRRSGCSAVHAMLHTNDGYVTWEVPACGKIGTAHVSGVTTSVVNEKVRTQCKSWNPPTACQKVPFRYYCVEMGATFFSDTLTKGEFKNPSYTCTGGYCSYSRKEWERNEGTTRISGRAWTATSGRYYKEIPWVTYTLCGDVYEDVTKKALHETLPIDVHRNKSFFVSVPATVTERMLYLTFTDGGSAAVPLDVGTYGNVRVTSAVGNSLTTNFNVTVN
jgi:hypothetical protein